MITDSYDVNTEPVINLKDFYGKAKYITDLCLVIFSEKIHTHLLKTYECKEIGVVSACNGNTTIYKMDYKGRAIAFYLSAIGSAILPKFVMMLFLRAILPSAASVIDATINIINAII